MVEKSEKPAGSEKPPKPGKAGGGAKAGAQPKKAQAKAAPAEPEPKTPARLKVLFDNEIVPSLMRELKIENRLRVPRLEKIVINIGLGEARENIKLLDSALEELSRISGQKPVITRAHKAISNFKLRKGMPIGVMVTLRRKRMYEFFDRLVNVALPRVRDFRGVSAKSFDGRGNYSLGLREHTIFPEVNIDKVDKVKGLSVSIITTARSDFEGTMLLRALGMPLRGSGSQPETSAA